MCTPVPNPPKEKTSKVLKNITNDPNATVSTGNQSSNPPDFTSGITDNERADIIRRQREALPPGITGISPEVRRMSDEEDQLPKVSLIWGIP